MYRIYDSQGNFIKGFPTFKQAYNYKYIYGNLSWYIKY